jgi:hypothetical protein
MALAVLTWLDSDIRLQPAGSKTPKRRACMHMQKKSSDPEQQVD